MTKTDMGIENETERRLLDLLDSDEFEVPPAVTDSVDFLNSLGIWFQVSRNHAASSCRDAARKRNRLGNTGIPLWDEMKSFLGRFICRKTNQKKLFVAHCRADKQLDFSLLKESLFATEEPLRLSGNDDDDPNEIYGLVNPFTDNIPLVFGKLDPALIGSELIQVFDNDLLKEIGSPGTVMTNAGDFTWAIEFYAEELRNSLSNSRAVSAAISVPDVRVRDETWGNRRSKSICIITGNSPESGMSLWQIINDKVRDRLGDLCCGDFSMPEVHVASLPFMGMTMELDRREDRVWEKLRESVIRICNEEPDYLMLACNTTHYFTEQIREICSSSKTEFLSMPEACGKWLRDRDIKEVTLVGISFVAAMGELTQYSAYAKALEGIEIEPVTEEGFRRINELAYQVKTDGVSESGLQKLRDILRKEAQADHALLALTELSLLLQHQRRKGKSGKVLIDPLEIYADDVVDRLLDNRS